jgi:alpha-beta hydrolase superfamily lysophospholipase
MPTAVEEAPGQFRMSDGFELFYRRWKGPEETTRIVVCLHGIDLHSGAFKFMGERLASEGIEVYALDYRGFGNSKEEGLERGDTRNFDRQLQDIIESLSQLRGTNPKAKVFMLGHSIGTTFTLWLAANHQDLIDGIILEAPPVKGNVRVSPFDLLKIALQANLSPRTRFDLLSRLPQSFQEKRRKTIMEDPLCPKDYSVYWLYGVTRKLTGRMLYHGSRIRKPALVIYGEMDDEALPEGVKQLFERLASKDKMIRSFTDADHYLYDTAFIMLTPAYDSVKAAQVVNAAREWLWTH